MARRLKRGELMSVTAPNLWEAWRKRYPREAAKRGPKTIEAWLRTGELDRVRDLDAIWDEDGYLDPLIDDPRTARWAFDYAQHGPRKNRWYTFPESAGPAVHSHFVATVTSKQYRALIARSHQHAAPSPLTRELLDAHSPEGVPRPLPWIGPTSK